MILEQLANQFKEKVNHQPWDIICDFDGTISLSDVTDTLLEQFADSDWQNIEQTWKNGLIGSRDCLEQQITLLDMSLFELNCHLDEIEIDPDFPTFVAEVQGQGHRITIVSDGLDYAIKRILGRYGLTSIAIKANKLVQKGTRNWKITFPNFNTHCQVLSGNCKCSIVKQHQNETLQNYRSLLIGDGTSDFCTAHQVNFVFAKNKLADYCAEKKIAHAPIRNFADVMLLLSMERQMTFDVHID